MATVTIITDSVKRVTPGAAPQPTPGIRLQVDADLTTVVELKKLYERKYRAQSGDEGAKVAHLEFLSGRVVNVSDPMLTVADAGIDGQALRAVFPRASEESAAKAPAPEKGPEVPEREMDDLGILEDEPDPDEGLSPLERAKARKQRQRDALMGKPPKQPEKKKPPPQPMPKLPPNAFPPQPVSEVPQALVKTSASGFNQKYDKWSNFGADEDSD